MADAAACRTGLAALKASLAELPDTGSSPAAREEKLRILFDGLSGWNADQRVYVMGQLDASVAVEACRAGRVKWWEALAGATYAGHLEELKIIRAAMHENAGASTEMPDLSTTMTWGAWPYSIAEGLPPAMNPDVLNQLFDWGADPLYNTSTYFDKALRGSPSGVIHAFLRHGAPHADAARVRDELLRQGNHKQAGEIQEALGFGGFFTKVDNRTVMETKYISEPGKSMMLRTIFNFGARRVNEAFEIAGTGSAMTSCNFEDYDSHALVAAAAALEKLGGTPEAIVPLLDKKKKPGLGGSIT